MKISRAIAAAVMVLIPLWCHSQTAINQPVSSKDSPPPGPLINTQLPKFCQWTVDYSYTTKPTAGQIRPVHVVISQTGDIRHEEWELEQHQKKEVWQMGTVVVAGMSKVPGLTANNLEGWTHTAFPEFDWISRKSFNGHQSENGQEYLEFKGSKDPQNNPIINGAKIAWIDAKTHYPIAYFNLAETRRYTFLTAPSTDLTVPPEFVAEAKAMENRIQAATPHLAPP